MCFFWQDTKPEEDEIVHLLRTIFTLLFFSETSIGAVYFEKIIDDVKHLCEKNAGEQRISDLRDVTGCSVDDFYIIPGNYDVQGWKNITKKTREKLTKIYNNEIDVNNKIFDDYKNYKDFLETKIECKNSLFHEDNGNQKPWYSRKIDGFPIRIIGLNSPLFTCEEFHTRGSVVMGIRQFDEAY